MLDEAKSKKDSDDAEFKNSMFGRLKPVYQVTQP
jgi:hypothetical protein